MSTKDRLNPICGKKGLTSEVRREHRRIDYVRKQHT